MEEGDGEQKLHNTKSSAQQPATWFSYTSLWDQMESTKK